MNKKLVETKLSVSTRILASEDGNRTFSITKEIEGMKGSQAYFILLYPTRTGENCYIEDSTNSHILDHLAELGFNSYTVINLFSQVTQSRLSLAGLSVDEENMQFIQEEIFSKLSDNAKVVIAWGNTQQNSPIIRQSKQRILDLWESEQPSRPLYQLMVDGMENDCLGVHPLFLGIRHKYSLWKVVEYPHKKVMKELETLMKEKESKKEMKTKGTTKKSVRGKKKEVSE